VWLRVLVGVESGVCAAVAMLSFFVLNSQREHLRWWAMPNLLGSIFYGNSVFRLGPGKATLAGVAVVFFSCGLLGALHALLAGRLKGFWRAAVMGAALAMLWHSLMFSSLFGSRIRLLATYAPQPTTFVAHLMAGFLLGRTPWRFRLLREQFADRSSPRGSPAPDSTAISEHR
jgi:hypothetical protein